MSPDTAPAIAYELLIDGTTADQDLRDRIVQIELEEHADMADMLRLTLAVGVREKGRGWSVLDNDVFARLTPIQLRIAVGSGSVQTLFNGYVIETGAQLSDRPGQSRMTVVAMDASVLMLLEEKTRSWPNMSDSSIAAAIFSEHGFTPQVDATQPVRSESDVVVQQCAADMPFLKQLAARNGYECKVVPNPHTGQNEGHFHPPRLNDAPQMTLSVNFGDATNVEEFEIRYDMLRAAAVRAQDIDIHSLQVQEARSESLSWETLGAIPALASERPRIRRLKTVGLAETGELQTYAQALVDRWALAAISAQGALRPAQAGQVLRARRPVLVRGAGPNFSGLYYVTRVTHLITSDSYSQRFTLYRNALGLTGQESFPS
ncbi:MAG: phage late control D family protein [Chloroflexi bacterium]|nr:MAG: phage late control D family protein [Chloroflexota bacterium]